MISYMRIYDTVCIEDWLALSFVWELRVSAIHFGSSLMS